MSGIFGILRFDGQEVAGNDMARMATAQAHLGPDRNRQWRDRSLGLGALLMRVTREDRFDAQPLHDPAAGLVFVSDARLDNREEVAVALAIGAEALRDMPDSALLFAAYKRWGADCVERLIGDFAFAAWDDRKRTLNLARDHMGQRAIHFHLAKDFFVFATELKALQAYPDVPRKLMDAQIGRLLMHDRGLRDGATLFEGIEGVTAATVMTVGADGSVTKRRYWEPHADPAHEDRDEAYYIEAYRRVLGEAVACRIRRVIRDPGLIFSGGYDSAAIAGLAQAPLSDPLLSGRKLIAAASVMPADYSGTIRHARPWVEMCARDMPYLDVRYITRIGKDSLTGLNEAFLESDLPATAYHFVGRELLSALAGAGARLVMDGHGGDYTLNPRGQLALARLLRTFQLRRFVSELRGHLHMTGASLWLTIRRDVVRPLLPPTVIALWKRARYGMAPAWGDQPVAPAFARQLIDEGAIDAMKLRITPLPSIDMRGRMIEALRQVMDGATPGLSSQAARHGLELTRPFHDKRVVELALAIPQELYVKHGRNRYLACMALKDIYPREYQKRWRRNDDQIPDFLRMAKSIEPLLLEEISRMEKSPNLTRLVDFSKIRRLLAARGPDDHSSGWEQETQMALHGFTIARYVEWFRRDNR